MLGIRSGYSLENAYGRPEYTASVMQEKLPEYDQFCIVERNSSYGFIDWNNSVVPLGKFPRFAVELAVSENSEERKPVFDYWTFLSTEETIVELSNLIRVATANFRYRPILPIEAAIETIQKGTIAILGNRSSEKLRTIIADKLKDCPIYLPVGAHVSPVYFNELLTLSEGLPLSKLVAIQDVLYPREADRTFYEIVAGRKKQQFTYPNYILSEPEWIEQVWYAGREEIAQALSNGLSIIQSARARYVDTSLPEFTQLELDALVSKVYSELDKRSLPEKYKERLDYEIDVIQRKNFLEYFALVYDIVQFCEEEGISIGAARGSSAGSLFCYLLGITKIDPLQHNLLFERFIDLNRTDYPDIDIDFPTDSRETIIKYLEVEYGKDHVARIATITNYRPLNLIDRLVKETKLDASFKREILQYLAENPDPTHNETEVFRKVIEENDFMNNVTQFTYGVEIESHPKNASQHASGMVISREALPNISGIDSRTNALMVNMVEAEALGLIKVDLLGLKQLNVIREFRELLGYESEDDGKQRLLAEMDTFYETIPDQKCIYDTLNQGKFCGVFQFNGKAIQALCSHIRIETFADICAITSLSRPGPSGMGVDKEWISKRKSNDTTTINPIINQSGILAETHGLLVYQEQVMQLCRRIGNMSWNDTIAVRKVIGKSKGAKALEKYRDLWRDGAMKNGLSESEALRIWQLIVSFGAYGFNKSHAVAYSYLTALCAYCKSIYPLEFAVATLTYETDTETIRDYLRELDLQGYRCLAVDIDLSTDKWRVYGESILPPLHAVKGVGAKLEEKIITMRQTGVSIPDKTVDLIEQAEIDFTRIYPIADNIPDLEKNKIVSEPVQVCDWNASKDTKNLKMLIGVIEYFTIKSKNDADKVKARGYELKHGCLKYLSLRVKDDTGSIFARIAPQSVEGFEKIMEEIEYGKYIAILGKLFIRDTFRMVIADRWRVLKD